MQERQITNIQLQIPAFKDLERTCNLYVSLSFLFINKKM